VRAVFRRHVVRHNVQVFLQCALRPPRDDPPESQPSAVGRFPSASEIFGFRVLPWERFL
jgi:hypothetical protein